MKKVLEIINRKPLVFIIASLVYLVLIGFLKWGTSPPWGALWFMAGVLVGIYFLDAAEAFFHLAPSPFRSIVFFALFVVVSFFVITSSGSLLASGLVLSIYLTLLMWQIGEWQLVGNLHSWYWHQMAATPQSKLSELEMLAGFIAFFILETYLFIR